MPAAPGLRHRPLPPDLGEHARDDLRFIRRTMERATSLTAFPGWGQVAIGLTSLVAAAVAARTRTTEEWVTVWLGEAAVAVAAGSATMALKAKRTSAPLFGEPWRRFALNFALPMVAGALLTGALLRGHTMAPLPGAWMLLYGVAIATGGAFSVPPVRAMGYTFMAAGAVSLFAPTAWRDVLMASAFGGLHVVFGVWIARRHGG